MNRLININIEPTSYQNIRIKEEAQNNNLEYANIFLKDLTLGIEPNLIQLTYNEQTLNITQQDGIIIRNPGQGPNFTDRFLFSYILKYLTDQQAKILNGDSIITYPLLEDKLNQMLTLGNADFPIIPTYYQSLLLSETDYAKLEYPLIIKPRFGSQGQGVELIEDAAKLRYTIAMSNPNQFILQEFIPNDFDIRVWTTPTDIIGAMKRSRTSGIVNNYSAGGNAEEYTQLPENIAHQSQQICSLLKCDYLGIDWIQNNQTNEWLILEVNRFGEFKGFELTTGINMANTLITILKNKYSKD